MPHLARSTVGRRIGAVLATAVAVVVGPAVVAAPVAAAAGGSPCRLALSATSHPGACWRPFAPSSPFDVRVAPDDPRTVPRSARIVARLRALGPPGPLQFGPGDGRGWGAKPIYFATARDPLRRVRLSADRRNGGRWGVNGLNGMRIRVPVGAAPSRGSDRHLIVVDQAAGYSYELWRVSRMPDAGGGLRARWGTRARLGGDGRGIRPGSSSVSGLSVLAGVLRPEELLDGEIRHALYLSVRCTSGVAVAPAVAPGPAPEDQCSNLGLPNADAPALGQRFHLPYTDAEIDAVPRPAHERTLLRAMARYGLIVMDATPDPWHVDQSAGIDRLSLGLADPGTAFARRARLPSTDGGRRYAWSLAALRGRDGRPGSWIEDLRVLAPCVSDGSCPWAGPVGGGTAWPVAADVGSPSWPRYPAAGGGPAGRSNETR